jgi:hypothetical protein
MLSETPSTKRPYMPPRLIDLSGGSNIAQGAAIRQSCLTGSEDSSPDALLDNPNCMAGTAPIVNCLNGSTAIDTNCNTGSVPRT